MPSVKRPLGFLDTSHKFKISIFRFLVFWFFGLFFKLRCLKAVGAKMVFYLFLKYNDWHFLSLDRLMKINWLRTDGLEVEYLRLEPEIKVKSTDILWALSTNSSRTPPSILLLKSIQAMHIDLAMLWGNPWKRGSS